MTLRLTSWIDDHVSLYGLMPCLIKETAYQSVIDAASHQKDLVKSKFLTAASHFMDQYRVSLRRLRVKAAFH